MNTSKLQEAVAELEAEASRCQGLADELKAMIKRSANGASHPLIQPRAPRAALSAPASSEPTTSQLVIAVEVLRGLHRPIHITELVPLVASKRPGAVTNRASVESALVRGMKGGRFKGVIRRTGPGTFTAASQ